MTTQKKITIAIDGVSSTGKSTLARQLASQLDYLYIDTGAMYRAVTLYALESGYMDEDEFHRNLLVADLNKIDLEFVKNEATGNNDIHLNGRNVEEDIRDMRVSSKVSVVAAIPEVRQAMVQQQRNYRAERGVVMDGRDIGTVVFPDAELKIYMTASPEVRAQRRYEELKSKGADVSLEEIMTNVHERDMMDKNRSVSPLTQADDAKVLDNSDISREEQLDTALSWAKQRIGVSV